MTTDKKLAWGIALIAMFCGCEKRRMPLAHAKPVDAVECAVEKFSRGGEGWGWEQFPEISREIQAITNVSERALTALASAEMIASMNLLELSQKERISVTPKYWGLTSQFYGLLVMDEITDNQRLDYLLVFLKTFRALCFSLPLCARKDTETDRDFLERRLWARDLYIEYDKVASRWHRVYRPSILKTIPTIAEDTFDKKTRFVCDYPSREVFLKNPVFTEELCRDNKGRAVKSPVFYGRHPVKREAPQDHASESSAPSDSDQQGVQPTKYGSR